MVSWGIALLEYCFQVPANRIGHEVYNATQLKTIQEGIKYWEEQGVITKKNTGYILNNLQEQELHKLYNPKITSSQEEL